MQLLGKAAGFWRKLGLSFFPHHPRRPRRLLSWRLTQTEEGTCNNLKKVKAFEGCFFKNKNKMENGNFFDDLMFTAGPGGDFNQRDQFYTCISSEVITPDPSPTLTCYPSWAGLSAGSTSSDDLQSFFPNRVMTNHGNQMSRIGTPANSLSAIFTDPPQDFRYSQPVSVESNFMPMPPTNPPSGNSSGGRRCPPSVRIGLTPKVKTKYSFCVFCKNNDEDESFYLSHTLKDDDGLITCPVLERYTCPLCKATGKFSHTLKYCPMNKGDKFHEEYASITELKALRSSTGKLRGSRARSDQKAESVLTPIGSPLVGGGAAAVQRPMRPILGGGASGAITPMLGELINNQRRQGQSPVFNHSQMPFQ